MFIKRGSLSLSANAIVILVLAMTLLGVGVVFVKDIFTNFTEDIGSVNEQVREQLLEDLRAGNKRLSFPFNTIVLEENGEKSLAMGIKNLKSEDVHLCIQVEYQDFNPAGDVVPLFLDNGREPCNSQADYADYPGCNGNGLKGWKVLWGQRDKKILKPNEANVYPLKLISSGAVENHLLRIIVKEIPSTFNTCPAAAVLTSRPVYAQKDFFLNIQ